MPTARVGPVSALNPPNFLPFGNATVTGNPSVIPVNTKSLFALETANYRDFLIFTAGLRFDNYNISASKNGFPTVSAISNMVNYNLGLVVKPLPTASVYAAYGTSSNPVGAELDGTSANYGGLQLTNASINQIFGPVEAKAVEVGTKWEFFDRHLLATGALFRTDVSNARELVPAGFPNAGTIQAGAAYHVQGIDIGAEGKILDKLSIFGGIVLMNNRVDASSVPTNVGLPLAFIANQSFNLLDQVSGQQRSRSRRPGDLSLENLRRHACSPPIRAPCCPTTGGSMPSSRAISSSTTSGRSSSTTSSTSSTTTPSIKARRRSCWSRRACRGNAHGAILVAFPAKVKARFPIGHAQTKVSKSNSEF